MKKTQEQRKRIARGMRRSWAERKSRRLVYVAGPMTGATAKAARSWRRDVTNVLERAGFTVLDPTRRDKDMAPGAVYANGALSDGERKFIHDADLRDVRMAHVILLYLNAEALSIGSLWEAGWADLLGKTLVIASPDQQYRDHPFVIGCGAKVFDDLPSAVEHIMEVYGRSEEDGKAGTG